MERRTSLSMAVIVFFFINADESHPTPKHEKGNVCEKCEKKGKHSDLDGEFIRENNLSEKKNDKRYASLRSRLHATTMMDGLARSPCYLATDRHIERNGQEAVGAPKNNLAPKTCLSMDFARTVSWNTKTMPSSFSE